MTKIIDELTNRTDLSRQRKWQLRYMDKKRKLENAQRKSNQYKYIGKLSNIL